MPNTKPPIMDVKTFEKRLSILEKHAYSDYAASFLLAGNCGGEASRARADFYKIFMGYLDGGGFSRRTLKATTHAPLESSAFMPKTQRP